MSGSRLIRPAGKLWVFREWSALFQVSEEFGVWAHHQGRAVFEGALIGFHGAGELEKLQVLSVGVSIDPKRFGITAASKFLRLFIGLGQDNFPVFFSFRPDFLRLLRTLGSILLGLSFPFRLHSRKNRFLVLFR